MKKIIGTGVILKTNRGTYLFQEHDYNTVVHPGKIAPFGGGIENNEIAPECAKRELLEELGLDVEEESLVTLGIVEITERPGDYIHMFLLTGIERNGLKLYEGKSIVELDKNKIHSNEQVTDFTKVVFNLVEKL